MSAVPVDVERLAADLVGRSRSLLQDDLRDHAEALQHAVAGRGVLVVGGAGSIGSATVRELVRLRPRRLVVVDHDENGLAELVRDLRSGADAAAAAAADLRLLPLDFGSPLLAQFLAAEAPFDLVLNFAALKHVRSEKDRCSLLQLFDTNLCKAARLLDALAAVGFRGRYFCVSTDKAADPVNLMGASKRLMEILTLRDGALPHAVATSARFANVAFSAGSLLAGFLQRLAKRQPLAVPRDTSRYFVTGSEAGQLCLLAAALLPAGHVAVPRLDAARDLVRLDEVAARVVQAHGYQPSWYDDEAAARAATSRDPERGAWPILRTPLDTAGEKDHERFVAHDERAVEVGMRALQAIATPAGAPRRAAEVVAFVQSLAREIAGQAPPRGADDLAAAVAALLPEFAHRRSAHHLDQRM
jgi:FlaA1/EpsC-like NDP-sugar epimerase